MKHILIILLIGGTITLIATPASSEKQQPVRGENVKAATLLPSVDQILDKNIKAIGGKAAIEKLTSRVMKGTFEIPAMGVTAPWEQQGKAPNKRLSIVEFPGMGKMLEGFDGTVGWAKNFQNALEEKKGEELGRLKRECVFYRDLKFKEIYEQLTVKGKQKLGDAEVYVIEAKPAVGKLEKLYFNVQTGLLAGWDSSFENDAGITVIKLIVKSHREVDGLKTPNSLQIDLTSPDGQALSMTMKVDQIQHNVPLEDSLFKKPAE